MRAINQWRNKLVLPLNRHWLDDTTQMSPAGLCDVELGLFLLKTLNPQASAKSLWTMLTGYFFPSPETHDWGTREFRMLGNSRHMLPYFRSHYPWERALDRYRKIDESLRGYEIDDVLENYMQLDVSICSNRWQVYLEALTQEIPHKTSNINWATADTYTISAPNAFGDVKISPHLVFPPPEGHNLQGNSARTPLQVTWNQLLETAKWMDEQVPGSWEKRLSQVKLELFNDDNRLSPSETLILQGMTNLIGMVSSGKSTLMDVLAVWVAKQGKHITIIVSDVMNALNRAQLFSSMGLQVAPVLGSSNRERHINRLHATMAAEHESPLAHDHAGFRWLSTACPLDGLRATNYPISFGSQPCLSLKGSDGKLYACPIYSKCPFHQAQRDLVGSSIWIATAASLIYTRVAQQINQESLRFAELVYRRSDLVIIDEADQIQSQLDVMFSPSQILVSRGADWLGQLWQSVVPQLDQEGRGQLANQEIDRWCQSQEIVQTTANRIYSLLLQDQMLRKWIERDYFTDWTLFDRLAVEISGTNAETRFNDADYQRLMNLFRTYMEDPTGEIGENQLATLTEKAILHTNEQVRPKIEQWLQELIGNPASKSKQKVSEWVVKLHFSLLLAALQDRLNILIRDWKQVEQPLKLESTSSAMFYSPPDDYNALVPASPMGNVLAFQYLKSYDDPFGPGDLRFFRCAGVGRWMLLQFHKLFESDGLIGPNVLLLSGTSWAGNSPSYHVQTPVTGVLRAPPAEVEAIEQDSVFRLLTFTDDHGKPIFVSGRRGNERINALKSILNKLALTGGLGGGSRFEREKKNLPQNRQKILLLVGSYDEAHIARKHLEEVRPEWRDQVINLVPDDTVYDGEWESSERSIQRGRVAKFAEVDAWLLIAPLLAIERGHNILNESRQAAIGAAYFLVRPHPHPTDLNFAIQSINQWAISRHKDKAWLFSILPQGEPNLASIGQEFRNAAYKQWRFLLGLPLIYSTVPSQQREAIIWNSIVTIWQAIGRLIRGGSPAHVYFCDAAFARFSAEKGEQGDTAATSLLVGMIDVLSPYFPESKVHVENHISQKEISLVQALYGPFFSALKNIRGVADATI